MIDYKKICTEVSDVVHETGEFISGEAEGYDNSRTETKGLHDFVSYVDKTSEKMLVDRLALILPEAGFITEEGTSVKKGTEYFWVIDPLDGTTNFIHGVKLFAISVGLIKNNEPVAGVVYEVKGKETFSSWKNGGAWLNGKPISVSDAVNLSDSLIATGLPYSDFSRLDSYMNCLAHFCKTTHGIRRFGSASVDLAYVACGRFEAFFEYGLKPWDVTAGALLVREAGGRFSNFAGDGKDLSGNEIVASNSHIYNEFLGNVSKFMCK